MNAVGANIRVTGGVQGVGYRYFCFRKAVALRLGGWVCNEQDGSVRVVVEGDRATIEELIAELWIGPPSSSVREVVVAWGACEGVFASFDIRM